MNVPLRLNLLLILFSLSFSAYTIYDGSKLIPISYAPNEDYDATEIVSTSVISQEMLSYYSWFASYGYCEDVDIPLFCASIVIGRTPFIYFISPFNPISPTNNMFSKLLLET